MMHSVGIDYDFDLYKFVSSHIFWLKFFGLYFNTSPVKSWKYWGEVSLKVFVFWWTCIFPTIGEIGYIYEEAQDVGDIAQGLYLMLSEVYTFLKIMMMWYRRHHVQVLLAELLSPRLKPTRTEHLSTLQRNVDMAKRVTYGYIGVCFMAILVAIVVPATERFTILPTHVRYPFFDAYAWPAYPLMYIHQVYYKYAVIIIDGIMDTIMASFMLLAIAEFEILIDDLENIEFVSETKYERTQNEYAVAVIESRKSSIKEVLRDCIVRHSSVLGYCLKLENAFSDAAALQFMLSSLVLCLAGIEVLAVEEPSKHPMQLLWVFFYLVCMTLEVSILCYFGNELTLRSISLQNAAFYSAWLGQDSSVQRTYVILMERCKKPVKLTAGKVFTLSLGTLASLLKWAYNAFALIRNARS